MKRAAYIISGSLISALFVVVITWLIGYLFGPLYHGEDESTRNFKIFLFVFISFLIIGAWLGNYLYSKKTLNNQQ